MKIIFTAILILLFAFQITFSQEKSKPEEKKYPFISDLPLNRKPVYSPKPEYPKAARAVNVSGTVVVRIIINESGNVEEAKPISGHPLLWAESIKSALATKYEPPLLNGKQVKVHSEIIYNFVPSETIQTKENEEKTQVSTKPSNSVRPHHPMSILTGKAIKLYKPTFPSNCRCQFLKNYKIIVQFIVNESGNVESVKGVFGHPLLMNAGEIAIRNSKFSVSQIGTEPVKAYGVIIYDFILLKKRWQSRVIKYELKLSENK